MAELIRPQIRRPDSYQGLAEIFEYCNGDGTDRHRPFNCGQAAASTLLTHHRFYPADSTAAVEVMPQMEIDHPPDNLGGWAGTSRRRVERICRSHGLDVEVVEGETELRQCLMNLRPVAVMVQTAGKRLPLGFAVPGGHWMVAYGFDDEHLYLTNSNPDAVPWPDFREKWNGFVPKLIGMQNRGLVAVSQWADSPPPAPPSGSPGFSAPSTSDRSVLV